MVAIRFLGSCVLAALMAAGMGLVGDSPVARAAPAAGVTGPVEAGDATGAAAGGSGDAANADASRGGASNLGAASPDIRGSEGRSGPPPCGCAIC